MKDADYFTAATVVLCAMGLISSQWEAAAQFLSTVFGWLFAAVAVALLLGWLAVEVRDMVMDWHWMGPPDLGPLRRRWEDREVREEESSR